MPDKKPARRHHYVPRYYLKHFANAQEQTHVYSKKDQKRFPANIKKVAQVRDFHSLDFGSYSEAPQHDTIEDQLNKGYENLHDAQLHLVLQTLEEHPHDPPVGYKGILAQMTALQIIRSPEIRRQMLHLAQQLPEGDGTLNPEEHAKVLHIWQLSDGKEIQHITEFLKRCHMQVLSIPSTAHYWTSDRPIITSVHNVATGKQTMTRSSGILRFGSELLFPLSPHHLVGWQINASGTSARSQMKERFTAEFNRWMWNNAEDQLYSLVPFPEDFT